MNTLKIYLKVPVDQQHYLTGTFANVVKDFPIYVGSYNTTQVNVYVPKSIMEDRTGYGNAVNMAGKFTLSNGAELVTSPYWFEYQTETIVNEIPYAVFKRVMPQTLSMYAGTQLFVFNLYSMNLEDSNNPTLENIITTQEANVLIQRSAYVTTDENLEPTQLASLNTRVTTNEINISHLQDDVVSLDGRLDTAEENITSNTNRITTLENTVSTGENYIGTYRASYIPLDVDGNVTEAMSGYLTAFVKSIKGESYTLQNGDTVIYVQEISGQTDKNYKMIYGNAGWSGFEIPPIEVADNGSLGIIKGTYGVGATNNVLVDINAGVILNIYAKDSNGNYINLTAFANNLDIATGYSKNALKAVSDALGNNIVDTYMTKVVGASKDYVKEYALPRQFNDVYYYTSNGFSRELPQGSVQFSATSSNIGDTEIFDINLVNTAVFELSRNNGYTSKIWFSSNKSVSVQFRLTTYAKKINDDEWTLLNANITPTLNLVANNLSNYDFSYQFSLLDGKVLNLAEGDKIRQVFEVVSDTSEEFTISVYCGASVQSTFNLVVTGVKVNAIPVIDNLTSTDPTSALSANQGRVLDEKIRQKVSVEIDDYQTLTFINN